MRVTEVPLQIIPSSFAVPEVSENDIVGVGKEFTVTDEDVVAEQAVVEFVIVTMYEVVEDGETTLLFPIALIGAAHEYVIPVVGFAVSVTEVPLQIIPSLFAVPEVSVKLMVGPGNEFTITEAEVEAAQLVVELVTVTVYEVVEEGETEILSIVPLVDQE